MLQKLIRHLLPGSCLLCDTAITPDTDPDLCRFCLEALPWNHGACPRCAEPAARAPSSAVAGAECRRCRRRPPPFTRTVAPLRYEAFPKAWIGRLKDHLGMVEGRILGTLLAAAAERAYGPCAEPSVTRPELLVPVPLTARRLARRGHNQALTLARPVAARLGIPLDRRAAVRQRPGKRQRGSSRLERLQNPAGHFVSRRHWPEPGPCIAIVDDVVTTGATAAELARVLLDAGAAEIHVLSATRTPAGRALA